MAPELITVLIVSLVAALVLTPLVRAVARRVDLVDQPERERKLHRRVVPLGGGIAVLLAATAGFSLLLLWPSARTAIAEGQTELMALLSAAGLLCLVGVIDDRVTLRGRQKLLGQIVAVGIVIYAGLRIDEIRVLQWSVELGPLAVPFTMFWLLGAVNALNLLDGADGFASTIGIVISGAIAVMAATTGHPAEALVAAALTGALIGFLVFNWPPAKIFLGDGGSMMIGLAIGVLAIRSSLKGPATVALAAPLALLAIPIADTTAAIVRRSLTGRGLFMPDRGHLHHRLQSSGLGPRMVIACVALICAGTSAGALLSVFMQNEMLAIGCMAAVLGILVVGRVFGYSEVALVANRTLSFGSSLVSFNANKNDDQCVWQHSVSLQGSRNWKELWSTLTDFAEQQGLTRVQLDLTISWLHEAYHAVWRRNQRIERSDVWLTRVPLIADGRTFGRLEIAGAAGESNHEVFALFAELLESLEPCVQGLAAELPRSPMEAAESGEQREASGEPGSNGREPTSGPQIEPVGETA